MDIIKVVNQFKELTERERTLRKQLEDVAADIRDAERRHSDTDKDITYGEAFPADLVSIENEIKELKARRNTVSIELKSAIEAVADYRVKHYPALREHVLKLYNDVELAENNLKECVAELQQAGTALDSSNFGGAFSMCAVRSVLIAGHSLTITDRDIEFFNNLEGVKEWKA